MTTFTRDDKFGKILVKEKVITPKQLDNALAIQKKEKIRIKNFILSKHLVEKGAITEQQLRDIETKYQLNKRLGETLVKDDVISKGQLARVLSKKSKYEFLGEILLKAKLLDRSQLYEVLKQVIDVPSFEAVLVQEELVTQDELDEIIIHNTLPPTLGEIFVQQKYLSVINLFKFMKKHKKRRPLGEMLVDAGLITQESLEYAIEKQKFGDIKIGTTLIRDGHINELEFSLALARQFGMRLLTIDDQTLNNLKVDNLKKIASLKDVLNYRIIPLSRKEDNLTLALCNPYDIEKLSSFNSIINFNLHLALLTESDFQRTCRFIYGETIELGDSGVSDYAEKGMEDLDLVLDVDEEEQKSRYAVDYKDAEAAKLLNQVISYAIRLKASDIHFEKDIKGFRVRFRIDGYMRLLNNQELNPRLEAKALQLISRLKVISDLDIAERRLPQDGSFSMSIKDSDTQESIGFDFRLSTLPSAFGENIVLRILDARKAKTRLDELYNSRNIINSIVNLLKTPSGMLIVTGPTGSGKTSTLYAALNYLNTPGVKILTAEDPIEYKVPGITQTQVNNKIGLTFAKILKTFLRQDPDIVMMGEIRDSETASIAIEASLTGHLVLTTMHTNDAVGAIERLRDLGISNLQIASSLKGVIAQRLVRKNCEHCSRPYVPDQLEWSPFFPEEPVHLKFYHGEGCAECGQTGYRGRLALSELLAIDREIKEGVIKVQDNDMLYKTAKSNHMKTIIEDGIENISLTTLDELQRVIPFEGVRRFREEYSHSRAMFQPLLLPEGCALDYQILISRSKKGMSKDRIRELFVRYRDLRKRLKEKSDHLRESVFEKFIEESFMSSNGSSSGSGIYEYRINLLISEGRRSMIMVESVEL
ncbi:Type IV fimbrial assembly, ATPase PilB [hydrothermal vent metagenome]|uniref:Type IV fimbrial assembly, ATPase PilB n=1 Tax=hydrothermal vent metagenome TaxID=652676 RepID=A0A3B1BS79_9ZZZZ